MLYAFDLDDTLYKEMTYVASGCRTVARALADATGADSDMLFRTIMAHRPKGFEAALQAVAGMPGADTYTVDDLVEIYRAHRPDIELLPGARELLERLRAQGHTLMLITDGSTRHQRAKIEALGLMHYFRPDDILISEETGGDKTTPVPWTIAEQRYPGMTRTYIGDNLSKDFHLPRLRGWNTIMLRDRDGANVFPQHPADWPADHLPHTTIDTLTDIR